MPAPRHALGHALGHALRNAPPLFALSLAGLVACSEPECRVSVDCDPGFLCVNEKCEKRPGQPPSGIIDGGIFDARPRPDAATRQDGGVGTDVYWGDVGDVGTFPDATLRDSGPDAGVLIDGGPPTLEGEIWISQKATSPSGAVRLAATAELVERSSATAIRNYNDPLASCRLEDRRFRAITRGFRGPGMMFSGIPTNLVATGTVTLRPSLPGRYINERINGTALFLAPNVTFQLEVFTGTAAGQLGALSTSILVPSEFTLRSPPVSGFVDLNRTTFVEWIPIASGQSMVVELYADDRSVVLHCRGNAGIGNMTVPEIPKLIMMAYSDEVMRPILMEVRLETEQLVNVPIIGGGTIPTILRASYGTRFNTVH
ncbi:MAG: hypothetical protein IT384_06535 [Deltaproteobacteria bacterium]|nr:hypothetical protein [Deltaproteobacteria bacterium]